MFRVYLFLYKFSKFSYKFSVLYSSISLDTSVMDVESVCDWKTIAARSLPWQWNQ